MLINQNHQDELVSALWLNAINLTIPLVLI